MTPDDLPAGVLYRYEVRSGTGHPLVACATALEAWQVARVARNQPDKPVPGAYGWDRAEQRRVREGER